MKKYKWLIIIAAVLTIAVFYLFYIMYQKDMKALSDFSTSYEKYDKIISDFSTNSTETNKRGANSALAELNENADFKLSSLIKNDNLLPVVAREIADLSEKEFTDLKTKPRTDLTTQRKTAYSHFQELLK